MVTTKQNNFLTYRDYVINVTWLECMEQTNDDSRGIYAGFKPNRISFYLLLLQTGRHDELQDAMFKDMEKYRIVK